jgi:uncharacterized protein (TIGR03067 family)
MNRYVVLALAVGLLVGADDRKDNKKDVVKKEMKKLEGTWTVTSGEQGGKPETASKGGTATITKSKIVFRYGKMEKEGNFKIDPTKSPKEINVLADTPMGKITLKGIYQLKGDSLKMCFGGPGEKRPTKLTTKAGTGQTFIVLKRVKAK